MLLDRLCCIDDTTPRPAALNMALDEALLLRVRQTGLAVLRGYRWRARSVSMGYFTPHRDVVDRYAGWEVVRRWTGGGIVEHEADFTYSLVLPAGTERSFSNSRLYRSIHGILGSVLRVSGVPVNQVTAPDPVISDACFSRAVPADLKWGERKVAGAAIRRHRLGVLLQGSVQGIVIPPALLESFAHRLAGSVSRGIIDPELLQTGERLAAEKYALAAWTERF